MKLKYNSVELALKQLVLYKQKSQLVIDKLGKFKNPVEVFHGMLKSTGAAITHINKLAELEIIVLRKFL